MKINELGKLQQVNENIADFIKSPGNYLVRKGILGTERGMQAQDDYGKNAAINGIKRKFIQDFIASWNKDKKYLDLGQQATTQQGSAQSQTQAATKTGPIMSNDPDAKAKLAALPPRTQGNATAQDAAARAGLTPNSDPRRNAGYQQAKNRQGRKKGPVVTGTTAAKPMTNGPQGGTRYQPTPRSNVQKLDKPMSDQDLRNIEANRQRMKEDVLEGAYSDFDALLESIMWEDGNATQQPQSTKMTPEQWFLDRYQRYVLGKGGKIHDVNIFKELAKEFQADIIKNNGTPSGAVLDDVADRYIEDINNPKDSFGATIAPDSQTATTATTATSSQDATPPPSSPEAKAQNIAALKDQFKQAASSVMNKPNKDNLVSGIQTLSALLAQINPQQFDVLFRGSAIHKQIKDSMEAAKDQGQQQNPPQ